MSPVSTSIAKLLTVFVKTDSLKSRLFALPAIISAKHAIKILSPALPVRVIEHQLAVRAQQATMMTAKAQIALKNTISHFILNNCLARLLQQPPVQLEFRQTELSR